MYRRLASYYGTPSVWLLLVSVVLLVWDHPSLKDLQLARVLAALLSVTLILLTCVMSKLARVECGEDGLLVQVPLYRVHVPYDSIARTRTVSLGNLFPPRNSPSTPAASSILSGSGRRWWWRWSCFRCPVAS